MKSGPGTALLVLYVIVLSTEFVVQYPAKTNRVQMKCYGATSPLLKIINFFIPYDLKLLSLLQME